MHHANDGTSKKLGNSGTCLGATTQRNEKNFDRIDRIHRMKEHTIPNLLRVTAHLGERQGEIPVEPCSISHPAHRSLWQAEVVEARGSVRLERFAEIEHTVEKRVRGERKPNGAGQFGANFHDDRKS
jgi:hypothetical protein